jgi:WD40 repeat protein
MIARQELTGGDAESAVRWPRPEDFDLFVVYAAADAGFVRGYLLPALNLPSHRVQLFDGLPLGSLVVSEIDRLVSRSRFTIAVLSPAYLEDRWAVFGEQLASSLAVVQGRIIPLQLSETELPLRLKARVSLDFTVRERWESEAARLRELLQTAAPSEERVPCPYPGMRAFTSADGARFFGRDSEINDLIDRLDRDEREIYVIGPSGSGKSSLVQAGLLHRLNIGSSRLRRSFTVCVMRPDEQPADQLVKALQRKGLRGLLPPGQRVLIFIDQLEELFTIADVSERHKFVEMLRQLQRQPWCYLLLALRADFYGTLMDSELWPARGSISRLDVAPLRGAALAKAIREPARQVGVYVEARLCDRLVADAATEPGALPLVQETMRQLWDRRSQRLLTLAEYEVLGGGGSALHVAIARRADASMHALSSSQQVMARRILIRLVHFGEGRPDTRRQQSVTALQSAEDDPAEFASVLQQLVEDRLVTLDGNDRTEDTLVDLSHEALITTWPALHGFVLRRRADELLRRRLEARVAEWIERGRGTAGLLDAAQVSDAEQWVHSDAARELGSPAELAALAAASWSAIDRAERQVHGARRVLGMTYFEQGRSLLLDGHPMQALPYLVAARAEGIESPVLRLLFAQASNSLPIACFPSAGAPMFSADGARVVTTGAEVRGPDHPSLAGLVARHAAQVWDTSTGTLVGSSPAHAGRTTNLGIAACSNEPTRLVTTWFSSTTDQFWRGQFGPCRGNAPRARLWNTSTGRSTILPLKDRGDFRAAAFSHDGALLVTANGDTHAQLWDTATGTPATPQFVHRGPVHAAAFSRDGKLVVTASDDNMGRVWCAATGELMCPPLQHRGAVRAADVSPDAARVVTASFDATARVWEVRTGKPLTAAFTHDGAVTAARFSPDGRHVVTASVDKTARVWNTSTGAAVTPSLEHDAAVHAAAFSHDGTLVVTASADRTAQVWDAATGSRLTGSLEHPAAVMTAAFSPDGARVFTIDARNTARIWAAAAGWPVHRLLGRSAVYDARFSADGTRVVTARANKTARVWDASTGKPVTPPLVHRGAIHAVAFSGDGTRVVTASQDHTARVWDAMTGEPVTSPLEHHGEVCVAEFSPSGARVVTAGLDHTARIWDVVTGKPMTPPLVHHDIVRTAAFSADGTRVVTASWDKTARIWDTATGTLVGGPLKHQDVVWTASFNADGTRVITASSDHTAQLWNAATGRPMSGPLEHRGVVHDAAFSPDGTRAVTAAFDHTARVWDVATGRPVTRPLEHQDLVFAAAFSPDGTLVVTASRDNSARVWDAATGKPVTPPLRHRGFVRTAVFSPDGAHIVTTSINKTAQLWTLRVDAGSLDDWRELARCCPFVLVDNVLADNADPLRIRPPR